MTERPDWLVALRAFAQDSMALEAITVEAQTAQVIVDYIAAVTRERDILARRVETLERMLPGQLGTV